MRANVLTSARFGTFLRVSRSGVSRLAIISGRAAFLAPEMGRLPFRCLPPTMLMRSMRCTPSAVAIGDRLYATRQAKKRSSAFFVRIIRNLMHGRTLHRGSGLGAGLGLALGQVGAQLRRQTLLASLGAHALLGPCLSHAGLVPWRRRASLRASPLRDKAMPSPRGNAASALPAVGSRPAAHRKAAPGDGGTAPEPDQPPQPS